MEIIETAEKRSLSWFASKRENLHPKESSFIFNFIDNFFFKIFFSMPLFFLLVKFLKATFVLLFLKM
jgi:hypothetical protein